MFNPNELRMAIWPAESHGNYYPAGGFSAPSAMMYTGRYARVDGRGPPPCVYDPIGGIERMWLQPQIVSTTDYLSLSSSASSSASSSTSSSTTNISKEVADRVTRMMTEVVSTRHERTRSQILFEQVMTTDFVSNCLNHFFRLQDMARLARVNSHLLRVVSMSIPRNLTVATIRAGRNAAQCDIVLTVLQPLKGKHTKRKYGFSSTSDVYEFATAAGAAAAAVAPASSSSTAETVAVSPPGGAATTSSSSSSSVATTATEPVSEQQKNRPIFRRLLNETARTGNIPKGVTRLLLVVDGESELQYIKCIPETVTELEILTDSRNLTFSNASFFPASIERLVVSLCKFDRCEPIRFLPPRMRELTVFMYSGMFNKDVLPDTLEILTLKSCSGCRFAPGAIPSSVRAITSVDTNGAHPNLLEPGILPDGIQSLTFDIVGGLPIELKQLPKTLVKLSLPKLDTHLFFSSAAFSQNLRCIDIRTVTSPMVFYKGFLPKDLEILIASNYIAPTDFTDLQSLKYLEICNGDNISDTQVDGFVAGMRSQFPPNLAYLRMRSMPAVLLKSLPDSLKVLHLERSVNLCNNTLVDDCLPDGLLKLRSGYSFKRVSIARAFCLEVGSVESKLYFNVNNMGKFDDLCDVRTWDFWQKYNCIGIPKKLGLMPTHLLAYAAALDI